MIKIWIVAGGTLGHIKPALILKNELEKRNFTIQWISASRDSRFVQYEEEFRHSFSLDLKGLPRSRNIIKWIVFFSLLCLSSFRVFFFYFTSKPSCIIGCGGFVSFLPLLMAWLFRKPYFILEQNSKMGLVNKLFLHHARKVFLGFPIIGLESNKNIIETGNPLCKINVEQKQARHQFFNDIPTQTIIIGVLGGSLGALSLLHWIKQSIIEREALAIEGYDIRFIVSTGIIHFDAFNAEMKKYDWIQNFPFIQEMEVFYAAIDCLVSRAGGMTLTEIIHYQLKSIIVPYELASENHQYYNAHVASKKYPWINLILEADLSHLTLKQIVELYNKDTHLSNLVFHDQPQFKIAELIEAEMKICITKI